MMVQIYIVQTSEKDFLLVTDHLPTMEDIYYKLYNKDLFNRSMRDPSIPKVRLLCEVEENKLVELNLDVKSHVSIFGMKIGEHARVS